MRLKYLALAAFLSTGLTTGAAYADVVAATFSATGPTGTSAETRGFEFSTSIPIVVTGLAYYDAGSDGLNAAHQVSIWTSTGLQLVSGTVLAGTADPLLDGFRFVTSLTGTTLLAPGTYIVGGLSDSSDANIRGLAASSVTFAPGISFIQNATNNNPGVFSAPTDTQAGFDVGYFGANFEFKSAVAVTPEPSSFVLLGTGLLGAAGAMRRRFRAASRA